jgi:hypothetical protein
MIMFTPILFMIKYLISADFLGLEWLSFCCQHHLINPSISVVYCVLIFELLDITRKCSSTIVVSDMHRCCCLVMFTMLVLL